MQKCALCNRLDKEITLLCPSKIYQLDDCNSNRIDIRHPRGCHPIPLSKKVPKQLYELDEDFRPTFPVTFARSLDVAFVQFHRSAGWVLPVCLPHRSAGWTKRCKMTTSKSRAARWLVREQKSIVRVSERVLVMMDTLFVWARLCEKRNSQKVTKQGWLCSIEMKRGSICADLGILGDVMAGGQFWRNISSNCRWGTQTV